MKLVDRQLYTVLTVTTQLWPDCLCLHSVSESDPQSSCVLCS